MHTNKTFFASANTSEGFISYFDTIFDANTLKEIFIIKGGPGTGKSGFMKRIANLAEKRGILWNDSYAPQILLP